MKKIKIDLKSFISDLIKYNTLATKRDEENKTVTIAICQINWIIAGIIQYFNEHKEIIEINFNNDTLTDLCKEANKEQLNIDLTYSYKLLVCKEEYFKESTTEKNMDPCMFEDYKRLLNDCLMNDDETLAI